MNVISRIPLHDFFKEGAKPSIPETNGKILNLLPCVGAVFSQGNKVSFRKLLFQGSHYSVALEV